jgi:DNA-directed RNA polymerase subunit N
MIIPVRCFTCGKVLGNKWTTYERKVKELEEAQSKKKEETSELAANFDQNLKGKILDEMNIERICCRRHMLSHIEIAGII